MGDGVKNFLGIDKAQTLVAATAAPAAEAQRAAVENDPIRLLEEQKKKEQEAATKLAAEQQGQRIARAAKKPSMGGPGRSGTILTSPLGVVGAPSAPGAMTPRKTILGG